MNMSIATRTMTYLAVALLLVTVTWAANKESILHSFGGSPDGADPAAMLVFDSAGVAYGTTVTGGQYGYGTVFQLKRSRNKWTETVLYSFAGAPDGKNPYGGVTLDSAGNLYGTTASGGNGGPCTGDGCGTVFELTKSDRKWSEQVLYSFKGGNDGSGPGGGVSFDKAGNLYGTTADGGTHSEGTVYRLAPENGGQWKETVIHNFTGGKDGGVGSLGLPLVDKAGNLYGVAEIGGAHGAGTLFKLSPAAGGKWTFSTLYAFKGQPNAGFPYGGLISDASWNLYGTTYYGGKDGVGSVFELVLGWGGHYKEHLLYSFKSVNDGNAPTSTLLFDASNSLWGTASAGGDPDCDCGAVFKLMPASGGKWKESVAYNFQGNPDGANPYYGLALDSSGAFYGTTAAGGTQSQGVVFKLTP